MRWIWIDRFLEFESGRRAVALKNLSLAEEHLHDHWPGHPAMPNSLITEGLAQTGGLLVGESFAFAKKVVLAKIPKATYHFLARPGDTLTYTAEIEYVQPDGSMIRGTSRVGSQVQAELEIVYGHLDGSPQGTGAFQQENFVFTLKLLGVFDVGRGVDGSGGILPEGLKRLRGG